MRLPRLALPVAFAFALALAPRALADGPLVQIDGNLAVQADKLEVDVTSGDAVLTGNVTLRRAT